MDCSEEDSVLGVPLTSQTTSVCLFSIGLIADIHFVDAEDHEIDYGSYVVALRQGERASHRRYRQSKEIFAKACEHFKAVETLCNIALGDVIDSQAGKDSTTATNCYDAVESLMMGSASSWHLCIGNNDIKVFSRDELLGKYIPEEVKATFACSSKKLYYSFIPHPGVKCIVLDSFACSALRSDDDADEDARQFLMEKNPNYRSCDNSDNENEWCFNMQPENPFFGLDNSQFHFVKYGGALGQSQRDWLAAELAAACSSGEKCFIFTHLPCHPECCNRDANLWDRDEVLALVQGGFGGGRSPVVAFFAGHDHDGGCYRDESGVFHIVPKAPIECKVGEVSFGTLHFFSDKLEIKWVGRTPDDSFCRTPWPATIHF